jgi:hypothetical protein
MHRHALNHNRVVMHENGQRLVNALKCWLESTVRTHPYLRAFVAGFVCLTMFLLLIIAINAFHQYYFEVPNQFVLGLSTYLQSNCALLSQWFLLAWLFTSWYGSIWLAF